MEKRTFLAALAASGAAPVLAAPKNAQRGPTLLTVTGAIPKANRGKFDPVADQMMFKQKLSFDKAWAFDYAALAALPALSIQPTLEYDSKVHTLSGPLLTDVLKSAGVTVTDGTRITLRAVDGYAAVVTGAQARQHRFIVATQLDGAPMALGGLGPLWAVYDADRVPDMAKRPVAERFGSCPWALYHIDIA
ncbi:molybdopterin-dependent oxidoreductase [Pseudoduganella lutea]|uniref:Molybdopterin-dependent oxidoreductase n=1 Tax=Pseudoduganella lutea TaxID=321985 RepID=A0A4P6KY49_9BURK|nr:molybdopterin-dependent oxidoreductase [Pseudoduganella lutea]QBE63675.1 molybdopterin-dependent oxidoreductase [Pseudoduganella lutea]